MNYEQVRDLNLLGPYLELVGVEKIEDLIDAESRMPPCNNPQIFLRQVNFSDYIGTGKEGEKSALYPLLRSDHSIHFLIHYTLSWHHLQPYSAPSNGMSLEMLQTTSE